MSDNVMATDTIKEMVRARYGGIAAARTPHAARLRRQRPVAAPLRRRPISTPRPATSAIPMRNSRPCRKAPISASAAAIRSPSRR